MRNLRKPFTSLLLILLMGIAVSGCSTTATLIEKRNLDVQTKMSDSIFLDPVSPSKQTVFLQVRNTSDKADFSLDDSLRAAIEGRGWRLVNDPDAANFMLQINILSVGQSDKTAAERARCAKIQSVG